MTDYFFIQTYLADALCENVLQGRNFQRERCNGI